MKAIAALFLDNPVLFQEIRSGFRRKRRVVLLFCKLLVVAAIVVLTLMAFRPNDFRMESSAGLNAFLALVISEAVLLCILAPAASCTAFTVERERKTFEILLATPLTPFEIVTGKLLASQYQIFLLVLTSAPLLLPCIFFGGLSPNDVLLAYLYLVFFSFTYGVIGLFFSLRTRKSVLSTSLTYLTILLLNAGPVLLALLLHAATGRSPGERAIFGALSTTPFLPLFEILVVDVRNSIRGDFPIGAVGANVLFYSVLCSILFLMTVKRLARCQKGEQDS